MNRRKDREDAGLLLAVDIDRLSAMLSCGHATARKIGKEANARITVGRRVLYSVEKVRKYLELIGE